MIEKLFTSKTRVKIIGFVLFEKPQTFIREISSKLDLPVSAVKREVDNLLEIGLFRNCNKRIEINKDCLFLQDIKNIFLKTDYLHIPMKNALKDKNIDFAIIFGSFVNGKETEKSDIDILVIGNVKQGELFNLIRPLENSINRSINPVLFTKENFRKRKNTAFIKDVIKKKKIFVIGGENEFQKLIR